MINSIPQIATVADLQRKYRSLVDKIKKTGEPLIIVSNGQPDVVIMDTETYNNHAKIMKQIEENYLIRVTEEALKEYREGKAIRLKKGQKVSDLLK